ncbi:MAG: hypothetical protein ACI8PZ_006406 [Myxococcota bacterium]|jgi:hypothetical protein
MLLLTALFSPTALACPHLESHDPEEVCDAQPEPTGDNDDVHVRFTETFLRDTVAHDLRVQSEGPRDAYFSAELRYSPVNEWVGRVGAGFDVFGGGPLDLTLGLFLGGGGTWDDNQARLSAGPVAGAAVGVGYTGTHMFAGYRWLAGLHPSDERGVLSENELTAGYRFGDSLAVFGQYVVLSPRADRPRTGIGIGARLTF